MQTYRPCDVVAIVSELRDLARYLKDDAIQTSITITSANTANYEEIDSGEFMGRVLWDICRGNAIYDIEFSFINKIQDAIEVETMNPFSEIPDKTLELFRIRFKVKEVEDPRPIKWPLKHPYWVTGSSDSYATLVAYANSEAEIHTNWPDAFDLEPETVSEYNFTDRFPRPDWFKD